MNTYIVYRIKRTKSQILLCNLISNMILKSVFCFRKFGFILEFDIEYRMFKYCIFLRLSAGLPRSI